MTTRRGVLKAGLGWSMLARLQAAPPGFWNEKDAHNWTPQEARRLLSDSPWAKPASISYNNKSRDVFDVPFGGIGNGKAGAAAASGFDAVVRWESSRAVRAAERQSEREDESQFYVLALIGDLPNSGNNGEESEGREQMLREFTKLERKQGHPIYLDHIEPTKGGTLFFFPRREPIVLSNRQIAFTTKIGPLGIKAEFPLDQMMYRGKLDL